MTNTQIKSNQILDGTIKSDDVDDSLEKEFTKVRATTDDSTSGFLSSKISAGDNITVSVTGASGSNQTLTISATGGAGAQGYQGSQGSQGSAGQQGSQGPAGVQGNVGQQGSQGPQGYQGFSGKDGDSFFSSVVDGSITSTGSLAVKGQEALGSSFEKGQDVFFYVSGTVGSIGSESRISLFGGDIVSSGSLRLANGMTVVGSSLIAGDSAILGTSNILQDLNVDGKLSVMTGADVTGSVKFVNGMSGSLTNLIDGTSYLVAGPNITITSASNGSVTISSSGGSSSAGSQGFQGFQGSQGPQGIQGDVGFQGSIGLQGNQGFQGDLGLQGSQGFQGALGDVGFQGSQGSIGQQGDSGQQGSQGGPGPQGLQGAQGSFGSQGNQGFQGTTGIQGPQGSIGTQGNTGAQGSQGSSGAQGTAGAMTLIETKTLSSTGSVTFSSLNGDTDKLYFLQGEVTVSSGANIEIHPNGNSGTVMIGSYITNTSGVTTPAGGAITKLSMPAASSVSSGERLKFSIEITADSRGSTFAPLFQTNCINDATGGGGAIRQQTISNAFTVRSAITSLKVFSTGGNMTGRISLYKVTS